MATSPIESKLQWFDSIISVSINKVREYKKEFLQQSTAEDCNGLGLDFLPVVSGMF